MKWNLVPLPSPPSFLSCIWEWLMEWLRPPLSPRSHQISRLKDRINIYFHKERKGEYCFKLFLIHMSIHGINLIQLWQNIFWQNGSASQSHFSPLIGITRRFAPALIPLSPLKRNIYFVNFHTIQTIVNQIHRQTLFWAINQCILFFLTMQA